MTELIARDQATLRANDRGGYTVPTSRLYPFQWNWDSAFVAMGWATFDAPRAWEEIELLLRGQWHDGMIPHIVFHAPSNDYFPGPDVWRSEHTPPTSGIPQPPILATAARAVLAANPEGEPRMAAIFPRLLANHRWWERARDPDATGLAATLHPWESGMDNSPAWDAALRRVPTDTQTPIIRRDISHVDAAMRPRDDEYRRFIHLVDLFRETGWNPARQYAASPFRVADVATNAVLLRAERDLLALAARFGTPADSQEIGARIERRARAIGGLWDAARGLFLARDLVGDAPIRVSTSAGFLPLYAAATTPEQTASLAETYAHWARACAWMIPSTDPTDPAFEPKRYWRGPIWSVVNWMIADGFAAAGRRELAALIRAQTCRLTERSGLSEYFDPTTGEGLGGAAFSWTAAVDLLLRTPAPA